MITDLRVTFANALSIMGTERLDRIEKKLDKLIHTTEKILMTVPELIQKLSDEGVKLDDISAKLTEGFAEITALIGQLQNFELPPEASAVVDQLDSKVSALQPQAQQIADIVPNP